MPRREFIELSDSEDEPVACTHSPTDMGGCAPRRKRFSACRRTSRRNRKLFLYERKFAAGVAPNGLPVPGVELKPAGPPTPRSPRAPRSPRSPRISAGSPPSPPPPPKDESQETEAEAASPPHDQDLYAPGPSQTADLPDRLEIFTRILMSSLMGGQPQRTFPTTDSKKNWPLNVGNHFCFKRDMNSFLPTMLGEPGCAFSTREVEHLIGNVYSVFICEGVGSWMYYGPYEFTSCLEVSLGQWNRMANTEKVVWCKSIVFKEWGKRGLLQKKPHHGSPGQGLDALKALAEGERDDDTIPNLRLLARIMRPCEYDHRVYNTLVDAKLGAERAGSEGHRKRRRI
ncbi:hypothetical protein RUND412_000776 [Rhizina undulata]